MKKFVFFLLLFLFLFSVLLGFSQEAALSCSFGMDLRSSSESLFKMGQSFLLSPIPYLKFDISTFWNDQDFWPAMFHVTGTGRIFLCHKKMILAFLTGYYLQNLAYQTKESAVPFVFSMTSPFCLIKFGIFYHHLYFGSVSEAIGNWQPYLYLGFKFFFLKRILPHSCFTLYFSSSGKYFFSSWGRAAWGMEMKHDINSIFSFSVFAERHYPMALNFVGEAEGNVFGFKWILHSKAFAP